tara:strand:+ start:347 stop:1393 length:1047 start_codon:yes stop_codon:yes gene_type:complete
MKTFIIFTTGRTGSDYLNSCLDNVKDVMTFCGFFNYYEFFKHKNDLIPTEKLLVNFFIKYNNIFKINKIENTKLNIDIKKIKRNFLKLYKKKFINRKDFLINIYKSYHLTLNRKLTKKTVLVHHTHDRVNTEEFLKDFPNSKIFITIRDPRANLRSGIYNWFRYNRRYKHMDHVYFYLSRIREDLNYILNKKNKKLFIKIEESNLKETKKNIFNFLNVKFDKNIFKPTLASKKWISDKVSRGNLPSKKFSSTGKVNSSIDLNEWKKVFNSNELIFFSLLYYKYNKFGYNIKKITFIQRIMLFWRCLLPYSFEKITFFQKKISIKKKVKNYFYYFKRVFYSISIIMYLK